jgi:TRAP-type mannitol/chloroaromatic compound transport system substrate-binding protein
MKRRQFIRGAGVAGTAAAAAAIASSFPKPAIAQSAPTVKWRLASSFPKSLDTLYGAAEYLCKRVSAMTDGKFEITPHAAGQLVPPLQVADAVQNKTIEIGHTASYYYFGKDPTFAFATAIPFGLNTRQINAWVAHHGGNDLLNEFYKDYNIHHLPGGHTGAQMGGWFRKEIKTPDDLKGLKMRIGGFAGVVMTKLGVVPQQIAGGDIYPALEKGTIDACEWVGPYDDEKLGFHKVAKFYYSPGWWEGSAMLSLMVNIDEWNKLPKTYQAVLESAGIDAMNWNTAKYDAQNPASLKKLAQADTQFREFPVAVLDACYNAAQEVYKDMTAKNAKFKKIYDNYTAFQKDVVQWFQFAEGGFDRYMARKLRG